MLSIRIKQAFICQLHRNHVAQPLTGAESLVFTSSVNGAIVVVDSYEFAALENCYLLSFDSNVLASLARNVDGTLFIKAGAQVVYQNNINFPQTADEQL